MRKMILLAMVLVGCSNPLSSGPSIDDLRVEVTRHRWFSDGVEVSFDIFNLTKKTFTDVVYVDVTVMLNGQPYGNKRELYSNDIPGGDYHFGTVFVPCNFTEDAVTFNVFLAKVE